MSRPLRPGLAVVVVILVALGACLSAPRPAPERGSAAADPGFTLIAVAGVGRPGDAGGGGSPARLRALRRELESRDRAVLVLHAGDAFATLPGGELGGEPVADLLARLDGDAEALDLGLYATLGERELAAGAEELDRLLRGSGLRWLASNMWLDSGPGGESLVGGPALAGSALVTLGGVKVGLFGLAADAELPPWAIDFYGRESTALDACTRLRDAGAEVVIALSHLSAADNRALLAELGAAGPDLVVGGHVATAGARQVGGRWLLAPDAGGRRAVVARLTVRPGTAPEVAPRLAGLGPGDLEPDPELAAAEVAWLERHGELFCAGRGLPAGCLRQTLGHVRVALAGDARTLRGDESNLGGWLAERAGDYFAEAAATTAPGAARVALLPAGVLGDGGELPPGPFTRRHLEQLLPAPAPLVLLRTDGASLNRAVVRAVRERGGDGWLQVSGLAFVLDPATGGAGRLTLLGDGAPRRLRPDETVLVATVDGAGRPLAEAEVVAQGTDLRRVVEYALAVAGEAGIAPRAEGRICTPDAAAPCLALP